MSIGFCYLAPSNYYYLKRNLESYATGNQLEIVLNPAKSPQKIAIASLGQNLHISQQH